MLRKLLFTVGVLLTASMLAFAQSGTLKGKIKDKGTSEGIPFVNIVIESGGRQIGGGTSDFDGNYTIKPIPPGKYDIKATYVGYQNLQINGVVIKSDQITFLDIQMESGATNLAEFVKIDYAIPLIDKGGSSEGAGREQIQKMASRGVSSVLATMAGVQTQGGQVQSVRGETSSVYYIDGVKVIGASNLPQSAIEQVTMISGGMPARYGDATGGVINITTRGPQNNWNGGVEYLTSQFIDPYGYHLLGFNVMGPLVKVKDKNDPNKKESILGFFVAGELTKVKEGSPAFGGNWKLNDAKLNEIKNNPLTVYGNNGFVSNASYLRKSDLVNIKANENVSGRSANLNGKLDLKISKNTNFTLGGTFSYGDGYDYSRSNSLMNYENNPYSQSSTYRVYGRFTQKFKSETSTEKDNKKLISNVFYTIQGDYSYSTSSNFDATHKDNIFRYGHVGKFNVYKKPYYEIGSDSVTGMKDIWVQTGFADTLVEFTPSAYNPLVSKHTQYLYDYYGDQSRLIFNNLDNIRMQKGLLNGDMPESVYGLYTMPGTITSGYGKSDNSQIGFGAQLSADIKNHAITLGFSYEQRTYRGYSYGPVGLWQEMRLLTNKHIAELDKNNPVVKYDMYGVFQDTINYNRLYDKNSQSAFDYNLRNKLGLATNGTDYINVDALDPETFSIDMFNADELIKEGKSLASFIGYDHTGKLLKSNPTIDDFFNAKDENNNYTRLRAPYQPIYVAGYIEDEFAFEDLVFNVGLRVDRFDANQKVLKDPYLLLDAKTASEVNELGVEKVLHPSNIGSDYTVYVDDFNNPTKIKGYRKDAKWYNASGTEITDPQLIASSGVIKPYLIEPDNDVMKSSSFKDYEAKTNILPRVSFSFPISDEAKFYAHYNELTTRPSNGATQLDLISYMYLTNITNPVLSNPNLQPRKTVDYELGFQQVLSKKSSLKIASYYKEMRNMVKEVVLSGAYPVTYQSYENIDYGTVKGFTLTYDLRQTGNVSLKSSYTLQFADGTGLSGNLTSALIKAGKPYLRVIAPFGYDVRHAISTVVDYQYGEGSDYNGPSIRVNSRNEKGEVVKKRIPLLENTGANLTFNYSSGTPYTAQRRIVSALLGGGSSETKGSYNGARQPGTFNMDAKISRNIAIPIKTKEDKIKPVFMNVYLQVLNVLNTKNIAGVYGATGVPNDDGYLSAPEYQNYIKSQVDEISFRQLYQLAVDSPYSYMTPRIVRLGVQLNF